MASFKNDMGINAVGIAVHHAERTCVHEHVRGLDKNTHPRMTCDTLKQELRDLGFEGERFTEYNNDAFRNTDYNGRDMEVFVDYHTIRIVWWISKSKKVGKCYYVSRALESFTCAAEMLESFICDMRRFL